MVRRLTEYSVLLFSWCAAFGLVALLVLVIGYLFVAGGASLRMSLIFGDVTPIDAILLKKQVLDGLFPAVSGTICLVVLSVLLAVPLGIAVGIYLAEYANSREKQLLSLMFDLLAGLPSIVVGLAGFSLTIVLHHLLPGRFGPCLLLSAIGLAFLILPYLIRSTQAALESVPVDLRLIALALGASKEQNILKILLPYRLPDILSGIVLAIGRAAEDTAVIMMTGAVVSAGTIRSVFDQFEALPYFIYYIAAQYSNPSELQAGFGAAILLLAICAFLFLGAYLLEHVVAHRLRR